MVYKPLIPDVADRVLSKQGDQNREVISLRALKRRVGLRACDPGEDMAYLLQFGTYVFPPTITYTEVPSRTQVPSAKLPRWDGARVQAGYLEGRRIRVQGGLMRDSGQPLQAKLDTLRAALQGGPAPLFLQEGRYLQAVQKEEYSESYEANWPERMATVRIVLVTGDPFFYEVAFRTVTVPLPGSPATVEIEAGGSAYALPQWRFTLSTSGVLSAALVNTANGDAMSLRGPVSAGDVVILDCGAQAVSVGGVDRMALFDGLFPRLSPGKNRVQIVFSGAVVSTLAVIWQNRWL